MKSNEITIEYGENSHQNAEIEYNDKMIDYETSHNLTYTQILSISKGLNVISEFYDVNAICSVKGTNICAVSLGQSVPDAMQKTIDSNPVDFMDSVIIASKEVDSETVKFLKNTNIIILIL